MSELVCAFTGHRPSKLPWKDNEHDVRCIRLKEMLREEVLKLIDGGTVHFLSGMALGTDTWSAECVLSLREKHPKIKLHCILPCKEQPDKWGVSDQLRYLNILEQADSIIYVSREWRNGCMLARNRFLVEHCAVLLAVYNGERRSGTAATVRYAEKQGRRLILLTPNL